MAARPFEGKESIPLELLFLLVEHNGEIVSREQIVSRIWGQGVFLDTDNSIRGAVRKLRQVLKDDADMPRFIQTVTGQGYRFIAPIVGPEEEHYANASMVQPGAGQEEMPSAISEPPPLSGGLRIEEGNRERKAAARADAEIGWEPRT